jgi:hypothetical protein
MTVAAVSPVTNYVGNGTVAAFPFPFPVWTPSQIQVIVGGGVTPVVLTLTTDYTVSGLNAAGTPFSTLGVVTLVNAGQTWLSGGNLATGFSLSISRVLTLQQLTSLRNQGDFYPETIEDALDYEMMVMQQLNTGGVTLIDLFNGHTYQLVMINGVLSQVQIS